MSPASLNRPNSTSGSLAAQFLRPGGRKLPFYTDLHTARTVGRSNGWLGSRRAPLVAQPHGDSWEGEVFFLLDAPISETGLFGEAVSSVVEKFHSAKSQSAALNPLMPRRITGTPQTPPPPPLSRERSLPRKEPTSRSYAPSLPPQLFELEQPDRPSTSAPPSLPWPSGQDEESVPRNLKRQGQTVQTFLPTSNTLYSPPGVIRLLLVAPFWPSQMWFSELIPLLYRPPWEIPIRQDLLSQLQGKIWHPQPEIWNLWV